jgi:hypothetical protein
MTKVSGIGIIVEDKTDYDAIKVLIKRLSGQNSITFKKKIGNGCGKIHNKCLGWSNELYRQKCNTLVLVRDMDRNNEVQLRRDLELKLQNTSMPTYFISIPIEELEAWFLADTESIKSLYKLSKRPKFIGLPETITSPKEKLCKEIFTCSNKRIIHLPKNNCEIAQVANLEIIKARCPSFDKLSDFINSLIF